MGLDTSEMHRNLDAKLKVGGMEAFDLLLALIVGAFMNFCFGGSSLEIPLVLGSPVLIVSICYFSKKGKSEKFMLHWIRFYLESGFFSASKPPKDLLEIRRRIYAEK